jgi:PAS domain S-box-containing protein
MSDDRFAGELDSVREGLERLAQLAEGLAPSHQAPIQEVLKTCSAKVEALQMAVEEREQPLDRMQKDQELLAELARSLERECEILHTLLQHTDAHLACLDPEFNFVRVNAAYARGSGYCAEDLIGRNHFELFPHAENQATFERVRDTGQPIQFRAKPFEYVDQPERGVTYWDWTLAPAKDKDDQVQGLVLSLLDVTEIVRAEQALREERDRAQRYLDIAGAIIVAIGSDETVTLINKEGCAILGYEQEDIIGKNWFDTFIPERERTRVRRTHGMAMAGEIAMVERFENTVLTRSGEERIISWHNAVVRDDAGAIIGALSSGEDITERTRARQQVMQQHQFLQNVLDSLPHPFLVINAQDRTVDLANSAADTGRVQGGLTCFSLAHGRDQPCDVEEDACPLHEVLRSKRPVILEHVHLDKDGGRQDVEVHGYPISDAEGNVVQMIEYTLDITERKQAEQALRESEARWRSLTETSPDHILMLDTDLKIRFANFAAPGLTVDQLIGTPLYTLVDESVQSEIRAILENTVQTGVPTRYETVYHPPEGGDIYYESRVAPRRLSGGGKVAGLTVSARDITERKQAEQALRDSEERLRALLEMLPVGVSVLDDSRRIRFANPALARILRLSQEQLRSGQYEGRTYLQADGTEMPPGEFPSYRAFHEHQIVRDVEICVVLEDGEQIWTSVSAVPLHTAEWRVIVTTVDITDRKQAEAALSQARDELELRVEERTAELKDLNRSLRAEIAERQRAEEELRASEERFRQLAENTEHIIVLAEPDSGRLLYVSPAYEKLLGRPGSKVPERIEQLWTDVHPNDLPLIPHDGVEGWLGREIEFRVSTPGNEWRWIRARAFPVRDEKGQSYRIVGIADDITEEKQALATLIEAEQLAIAGRMAASLAHEINNPLQAAIGCLDLSMEQLDQGKDPRQHLQVTADALDRASRVVAQLRALHYPTDVEGKKALHLNEVLEKLLVLVQKRCIDQHVEVDWQAAQGLPPMLLMHDAIQQVFLNLLLNALDAMPEGGRLQISTGHSEEPIGVLIRFSDSGYGISAAALERVFEPFYSTKPNSLGLGLFISHSIVQEHGGRIEVQSQEDGGTTFSVWLPISSQESG